MSRYTVGVVCAREGCPEAGLIAADTRAEQREIHARQRKRPWHCARHRWPDEVLTVADPTKAQTLVVYETDYGRYWREEGTENLGSGFAHGPGFRAFANDFPAGTRLTVTAVLDPMDTEG